jgi:membrane protein implicated in regulation of membrane protease activity
MAMLETPAVPASDLSAVFGGLPLQFELSPFALIIIMALVLIFFAVVSVVLIYHWRRFPFEHQTFHRVERLYEVVSIILVTLAVGALFFS